MPLDMQPHVLPLTQSIRDRKLVEKRHELEAVDKLRPLTEELDCSLAQLALAWCANNPRVSTVITGATKVEQVRAVCGQSTTTTTLCLLCVLKRHRWCCQVKENMKALEVLPKLKPEHAEFISGLADQVAAYSTR